MKAAPPTDSACGLSPLSLPETLQALSPAQARFCLGPERFVRKELGVNLAGTRVLAGFSGGADSTALLLALHYLAPRSAFSLYAAHLDHGLRPGSAGEADACRRFCEGLGIPFFSARLEQTGRFAGIEDASRKARYDFFDTAARQCGADWIATGHNANDLAEDVLMRLTRGAGWPGLSGMAAVDPPRRLLRPLLLTGRGDIEAFLRSLGTGWCTDESNSDRSYFRNRVRHDLLPFFLKENPAFLDAVAGLWRLGRIDGGYFEEMLEGFAASDETPLFLERRALEAMPKALRLRLYKRMLDELGMGQALMPGLFALDEAFLRNKKPTTHQFPGGKRATADARGIRWSGSAPAASLKQGRPV